MSAQPLMVRAFAPASIANLGPGFDVLGMAVEGRGDRVTARLVDKGPLRIRAIRGDGGKLPLEVAKNTAGIAAFAALEKAGLDPAQCGIELELDKGMPIGSGLGSSAASAAAAAVAVNHLVGAPLRRLELVGPCIEAEAVVSGRHADNVAPALLGGLLAVRSVDPLEVVRLPVPDGLLVVVCTPDFELATRLARQALPATVPLADMVHTAAHLASFVAACYAGDLGLLARSVADRVVEPARAALIPGAEEVVASARRCGALGSSIAGGGPSVFALCHSHVVAASVSDAMIAAFAGAGLQSTAFCSVAGAPGARAWFEQEAPESET
jgi:homoserine kinase